MFISLLLEGYAVKADYSHVVFFHPSSELLVNLDFDVFQARVQKFVLVMYTFVLIISLASF